MTVGNPVYNMRRPVWKDTEGPVRLNVHVLQKDKSRSITKEQAVFGGDVSDGQRTDRKETSESLPAHDSGDRSPR